MGKAGEDGEAQQSLTYPCIAMKQKALGGGEPENTNILVLGASHIVEPEQPAGLHMLNILNILPARLRRVGSILCRAVLSHAA